jgi:uncharacterized membrane protein YdfJ with MMPL/SSD domain
VTDRNLAARAGRWSARHRKTAIFGWLAFVVACILIGGSVGLKTLEQQDLGNGDSGKADKILARAGFNDRATERVLVQARDEDEGVRSAAFRGAVADVVTTVKGSRYVTDVKAPVPGSPEGLVSRDGRSALVVFDLRGDVDRTGKRVAPIERRIKAVAAAHPNFRIAQFGDASAHRALSKSFKDDFRKAETLSLPITLAILVVAFGALVAAGIPVLLGLSAVAVTLGIMGPISQLLPVDEAISSVILLIGLAVGVDYSLFYIRRERDEREAGRDPEAALEAAAATSGRAVLISGFTVMIAMAGMYLTGNPTFQSFATGTILVVAVAMTGSVTVLPALLSKLGDNVNRGRVPLLARVLPRRRRGGGAWAAVIGVVLRRPWISAVSAAAILVVAAIPAFSLHTVNSGVQGLPRKLQIMQNYDRIQAAFPGGPLPAVVAVHGADVTRPDVVRSMAALRERALASGQVRRPVTIKVSADKRNAVVALPLVGSGTDDASYGALRTVRDDLVPATLGKVPGIEAPVTGLTAGSQDFNDLIKGRAPIVFAFVLSLAFVLLMVTFRSIVIPLKAILLNLLSVGAAYGVLVWVFQEGHLEKTLGFTSIGGITAWLPLFLFVVLFGLSMDYHVFILTRIREAFDRGQKTEDAVAEGITATAGVVTSAAVVMVAVFAIFGTLGAIDFKMMGVGLAVAVLIDATIVRAVLLPATMKLLGDWNWYLPRWLEWLPHIAHEPDVDAAATAGLSQAAAEVEPGARERDRRDAVRD